jgi:xanthine dehydrogenase accessory factor
MWHDIINEAARLRAEEQPFVIATVVAYKSPQSARPGSKAIIKPDGTIEGWIGGGCVQPIVLREAKRALETGKPKLLSISPDAMRDGWKGVEAYNMTCEGGGSLEIYLEPVLARPELLIVGHSPVAQILVHLGKLLEFKVCLVDEDATQEQFPEADSIVNSLDLFRYRINASSYVVVATMGNGDEEGLQAVVGTEAKYIGLVASKEKARALFEYVRGKGATDESISRIKCPAGLGLGSETLPEIALSVMAEITLLRRGTVEPTPESEKSSKSISLPVMQKNAKALSASESIDPVCGMTVETENAKYKTVFEDKTYYFCCLRCKEAFENSPQLYLQQTGAGEL